ncbi:MAG: N-acetyltransferase domain-containing protein [Thermocaproicibacter melissae]|jgi:predicted acetyltransferase|uniref:GNAT family N-acetyltransferase n=1 Tax=Thermocaproicibacter melissae TaxID=2966552 RepID=UPI0024B049B4|nr:GNAT family N-acetyltransferase [Thermocaproicibacter melissae]WBY64914.1 GNAT family N-acetyltransferase [Thermocaproicibacter melissae]
MIEFAQWNMRRELSALWQEAFEDSKRIPDFFLNNLFSPHDCLVYKIGTEIASVVYLLPASVLWDGKTVQAHYIFAAATAKRYRSRGYMSSLLAYAALVGAKRGDYCSVLLPSERSLSKFYQSNGYADFYRVKYVELSAKELQRLAGANVCLGKTLPGIHDLNRLRRNRLAKANGSLLWSDRMFALTTAMSKSYGDKLVCASGGQGKAYALCSLENDFCEVLEAFAADGMLPQLAAAILKESPASKYRFRLPVDDLCFPGQGDICEFGMIKPLGGRTIEEINPCNPYLGLCMD